MFHNRRLIIATQHHKEKVIAPLFEDKLGVLCFTDSQLNTDVLGTFSGEVERNNDPITTARNKCIMAMELSGADLAIASEGSFGAHPSLFFAHADDEWLLFVDRKINIEIVVRDLSLNTNFNASSISNLEELNHFANKVKFPSHALIIKKSETDYSEMVKGIQQWDELTSVGTSFLSTFGSLYVETDMRAMNNPTRMAVIEQLTHKLIEKIESQCPHCQTPGFAIADVKRGLPCEVCHCATNAILSHIYCCAKCSFTKEIQYPEHKYFEDPMYCDFCNP